MIEKIGDLEGKHIHAVMFAQSAKINEVIESHNKLLETLEKAFGENNPYIRIDFK